LARTLRRVRGIPTKLARTLPNVPEGFQFNWVGRFSASRGLQLINILHIPNTSLFLFVLDCVMRVTMRAEAECPRKARVFRTECDHLAAEGARQALSVVLAVRPSSLFLTVELVGSNLCADRRRPPSSRSPLSLERDTPESGTLPIRLAEGSANFDCQFSEVRKELREIGPGESALRPGVVVLAGQSEGKLRCRLAIYERPVANERVDQVNFGLLWIGSFIEWWGCRTGASTGEEGGGRRSGTRARGRAFS
jgi:hypothetical protein